MILVKKKIPVLEIQTTDLQALVVWLQLHCLVLVACMPWLRRSVQAELEKQSGRLTENFSLV